MARAKRRAVKKRGPKPSLRKRAAKVIPRKRAAKALARKKSVRRAAPRVVRRAPRVTRAARWFRESVQAGRRRHTEAKEAGRRSSELKYLHDAIEQLRHHYRGFDAASGYSLKRDALARLSGGKLARVKGLTAQLRRELSQTHKIVRPRTRSSVKALERHTGAKPVKGRKSFVVHVEKPEQTTVSVVKAKRVRAPARVKEVRKVRGARVEQQYFYFRDYRKSKLRTLEDVLRVARKMLRDMPPGHYVMYSSDYGNIGVSMNRDLLLRAIQSDWLMYDKVSGKVGGLASTLIGFKLVASTLEGAQREYRERLSARQQMQRNRHRLRESKQQRRRRLLRGR